MKILNTDQVRKWDAYTIGNEPITSWELMERAASQCTQWLLQNHLLGRPVKIFCGKGNNGGDGLAIACQLAEKGIIAQVFILEFGAVGTPDFQRNLNRLHAHAIPFQFIQDATFFPEIDSGELLIDALFGLGVNRPLKDLSAQLVQYINASEATIVSIDLPSGLFADNSTLPHPAVQANFTLTFQALKLCFLLPENEQFFGEVVVLPIGLMSDFVLEAETDYEYLEQTDAAQLLKKRSRFAHKGSFGHTLIVAGSDGKMGAAILATKACLRSGAGLVTAYAEPENASLMHHAVPEAMLSMPPGDTDWSRYNAIGVGPGLGTDEASVAVLTSVIEATTVPLVLDADALNILSQRTDLFGKINDRAIITPHPKEFERLFGKSLNDYERLQLARTKAMELGIVIVLKGHRTAIACSDGQVFFNSSGNPGMATAGSGDVLTGIISGLLSQQYSLTEAAKLGVYLHGLAGDLAAKQLSEQSLIAGDITRFLGEAYKRLQANPIKPAL